MEEKRYLKWYNKVGYGSGDIAGIVGTLIAVSKFFDGVSDIFFGSMIDITKSKRVKARPWMFNRFFGCTITLF